VTHDRSPAEPAATEGSAETSRTTARPSRRLEGLAARWERTRVVLRAPRVRIEVFGDAEAESVYRAFTARHRRFKVTSAKRWGVALLALPASGDAYLASVSRLVRRQRTKALSLGYRHVEVPPGDRVDQILAVNRSVPSRQGRPMDSIYTERERVIASIGARPMIHAVVDRDGTLQAYADVLDIGGAFTFSYLIGHADHLADGIMYLLVAEIVRSCIAGRRPDGTPAWLMVDTFWGASPGLASFKERTGFRPYTVDWRWVERPPVPDTAAHDPGV
jgi:hypothetical protein